MEGMTIIPIRDSRRNDINTEGMPFLKKKNLFAQMFLQLTLLPALGHKEKEAIRYPQNWRNR